MTDFIHDNRHRLNNSIVLLSLNPPAVKPAGYRNFHSPASKHFDSRLKKFIQDNGFENIVGAYMTDIVPDVVDSDSSEVAPEVANVEQFLAQLDVLGNDEYDIICFSRQSFEALQEFFRAGQRRLPHNIASFGETVDGITVNVNRVWHYSNWGANAEKVPELEQQLTYLNDVDLS